MRVTRFFGAAAAVMLCASPAGAGQGNAATPGAQPDAAPVTQQPAPAAPAPGAPAPPPAPTPARTFTAPVGLLFNTVRADRVGDFERVLGYLQTALEKSTDPTTQAQARGWRFFKAAEPGPNGSVLYVFLLDPAVASADYGLGRILADAYPDTAQLQEIWKLYTGAVTSGGTLLNLTSVQPPPPGTASPPASRPVPAPDTPASPVERPLPPDADPDRQPLTPGK